jgi:hypothetical protein
MSHSRSLRTPVGARSGGAAEAGCVGEHSACTSISSGRLPSITTVTAELTAAAPPPPPRPPRPRRKSAEGLATAARPPSSMENTPTSSVAPYRFFTHRTSRTPCCRAPSM